MRTTIDIEDDVLLAMKEMARRQNRSAGQVVSELLREALLSRQPGDHAVSESEKNRGGFRPFASQGVIVTDKQVNALRDAEGI